jgi:hypothetical protein
LGTKAAEPSDLVTSTGSKERGRRKPFQILKHGFGFKTKDFKYFQTKFELGKTKINFNKLFEYFSKLELFKIDSNIQIQTKALNGVLLK